MGHDDEIIPDNVEDVGRKYWHYAVKHGGLCPDEKDRLKEHIKTCEDCKALWHKLKDLVDYTDPDKNEDVDSTAMFI